MRVLKRNSDQKRENKVTVQRKTYLFVFTTQIMRKMSKTKKKCMRFDASF